jgi:EAL domain-containing protein (putative c-di-GMP-specific phosphodiesterase class I)
METTAEGVETKEQLDIVRAEGCTDAQGFYFSVPRPVKELTDLLGPLVEIDDAIARTRRLVPSAARKAV